MAKDEPNPTSADTATVYPDAPTQPPEAAEALRSGAMPSRLPALFGRYRLENLLGKGGMGAVYLALDTQLDRHVALKVPRFGPDDAALRERFLREARAAGTLHHPNLCPVFDVGDLDGVFYMTMAYIEGEPLSARLRAVGPMPPALAVTLVRTLALALCEAHAHGIIHRDLKPANVMLDRKNEPVIMDFGLARRESVDEERITHSGAILGTPAYMPPEQVNGDVAAMGPCCDIYSLGVILYELLVGRRPFDGPTGVVMAKILRDPPPSLTAVRPDLDPALETICLQALAKRPQHRHLSMQAFAAALDRWLAGKAPPPLPVRQPLSEPPPVPPSALSPPTLVRGRGAETVAAPAPKRAAAMPQRPTLLSGGQKWFLIVGGVLMVTCVLPIGGFLLVSYLVVQAVWPGIEGFFGFLKGAAEDGKAIAAREEEDRKQWEDARGWTPPPADAGPDRLFPVKVGKWERVEQDDQVNVPGLMQPPFAAPNPKGGIQAPPKNSSGRRALYQDPRGKVELFAFRMKKNEKDIAVERAVNAIGDEGLPFPAFGKNNLRALKGSAEGTFLRYERDALNGISEQRGIFWWDRDWLFFARNNTKRQDPGEFLKEYIDTVGAKNAAP